MRKRGAQRRASPREDARAKCEGEWEAKKGERMSALKEIYGQGFEGHNSYGEPILKSSDLIRDIDSDEIILGLERASNATGDPIFSDALRALQAHGLGAGQPRRSFTRAAEANYGRHWTGYLENMRFFCGRRGFSIPDAAEKVAAYYFVDGKSFSAVTKKLSEEYRSWERDGFPPLDTDSDPGDLGYCVLALPRPGVCVPIPNSRKCLPPKGAVVSYTSYWRRRFHDGDVSLQRIGDRKVP
jgi:Protein of unknown function (DUF2635)